MIGLIPVIGLDKINMDGMIDYEAITILSLHTSVSMYIIYDTQDRS